MPYDVDAQYINEVVELLIDARFYDSMQVIQTASSIHDCILVPYPSAPDVPMFAAYPPLQELVRNRPLILTPEVQAYIQQSPPTYMAQTAKDPLFLAREWLVKAYQQALIRRADQLTRAETRIDALFPSMTTEEYHERVAFVVERALSIPIHKTIDWWADVTCRIALTSPSQPTLAALSISHPESPLSYQYLNSWRQIGYLIERLQH